MGQVPIIDCSALFASEPVFSDLEQEVISQIHSAFSTWGVFILTGQNGIPPTLTDSLYTTFGKFFSLPQVAKDGLHLKKGGWAWRGYMPWGGEGTKGGTDQKEGFYAGPELPAGEKHPMSGMPTYGQNQFPDDEMPELRDLVLEYIERATELGITISDAISAGLGLGKEFIRNELLSPEPVQLFRTFKYSGREGVESCGIGDHSDFGFLTILTTNAPGLQVLSPANEWVDVPVIPNSFVVNVGDILDRLTSGLYVSPLHHVLPPAVNSQRISIPFFFDPAWTAKMRALPLASIEENGPTNSNTLQRWRQRSTFKDLQGSWGDYLGVKVKKIFPDLELPEFSPVARPSTRHLIEVRRDDTGN